ncbi:unnamed protein product [Brassica rapa]|uniref:Uncharacterized protein n=1 Tax=Brassica campestris TaxID=3711 RepID=A0A8D9CT99_BRACM|nr:unnamed protein product [Brassica rapa]
MDTRTDVLCVLTDTHGRPVQPTWAKITRTVHGKGQRAESKDQRADMCTDGHPRTSCVCWRTPTDVLRPVCADGHTWTQTNILCVLTDTHGRPVCADGQPQTATNTPTDVLCVLNRLPTRAKITRTVHGKGQRAESKDNRADMCTDGQPRTHGRHVCADGHTQTAPNVLCVLTDIHGRPVCADGHPQASCTNTHRHTRTATDVLCVLVDTHGRPVCTDQTAHVGQNHPNRPKSPEQSAGRVSVLSPRTNVLICVLMDSHVRPVCADGHTRTAPDVLGVLTDTHGRPVCADGHPQTSYSHGSTVCAGRHPRTSCTCCVCWRTPTDVLCVLNTQPTCAKITQTVHGKGQHAKSKDQRADMCTDGQPRTSCTNTDGHTRTATDVLCVLADTHGHPVYEHTRTHTDSHGCPVCAGGHPQTSCVPVCADGHPQTSYVPRGPKSPKQSMGRASVLTPRTNVLICVLMDSHGRPLTNVLICVLMDSHERPLCADGHTRTHTDSHRRPVCAGGHPRTQPTWAKITQPVHKKGQRAESKDQRADMSTNVLCVLADTHRHTRIATDVLCVLTDSHGQAQTCCVCWRTPTDILFTDILCVLTDSHRRPVCAEQTAHVGQNHPNSPREGPAC